jgi:hypothetical protein
MATAENKIIYILEYEKKHTLLKFSCFLKVFVFLYKRPSISNSQLNSHKTPPHDLFIYLFTRFAEHNRHKLD